MPVVLNRKNFPMHLVQVRESNELSSALPGIVTGGIVEEVVWSSFGMLRLRRW